MKNFLTDNGRQAKTDLDGEYAELDFAMAYCSYCKKAKRLGKRGCKKHLERRRLAYVTSPVSETYWSS